MVNLGFEKVLEKRFSTLGKSWDFFVSKSERTSVLSVYSDVWNIPDRHWVTSLFDLDFR